MIDPQIARLCLQFLDGDESVLPTLADRLKDAGHPEAEVVRTKKTTVDINGKKFPHKLADSYDVVCYALPDAVCWHLLCDFAEHVLFIWEDHTKGNPLPRQAIAARRAWLAGGDVKAMERTCEEAWIAASNARGDSGGMAYPASDAGKAATLRGDVRGSLRGASKYAQNARWDYLLNQPTSPADSDKDLERDWQRSRIRSYLTGEVAVGSVAEIQKPQSSTGLGTPSGDLRPRKQHPVFGTIQFVNEPPGWWEGAVPVAGVSVQLDLQHGANLPASFLENAVRHYEWIRDHEPAIREYARDAIARQTFNTRLKPRPKVSLTPAMIAGWRPNKVHCLNEGSELTYKIDPATVGADFPFDRVVVTIDNELSPSAVFVYDAGPGSVQ